MPESSASEDGTDYSETVFPEGLENTPRRFAIAKRNSYLVSLADVVVTYVTSPAGGAAYFKEYAEKQGKRVINLPDLQK